MPLVIVAQIELKIIAKVNKSDYEVICKNEEDLKKILE